MSMSTLVTLNEEQGQEIFTFLHRNYADLCLSDLEVQRLKSCIQDANATSITKFTTKRVLERYFQDRKYFNDHPDKNRRRDLTVLFKSCYVLICFYQERYKYLMYNSIDELKEHYPQFVQRGSTEEELKLLLRFRNVLRVALEIIDAQSNKHVLLKIAGRLEGSHREYITGGGQTQAVKSRVEVYEQEGAVQPKKRPERKIVDGAELVSDDAGSVGGGHSPILSVKRGYSTSSSGTSAESVSDVSISNQPSKQQRLGHIVAPLYAIGAASTSAAGIQVADDPPTTELIINYKSLMGAIKGLKTKFNIMENSKKVKKVKKEGKVGTVPTEVMDEEAQFKALRAIGELTARADTFRKCLVARGIAPCTVWSDENIAMSQQQQQQQPKQKQPKQQRQQRVPSAAAAAAAASTAPPLTVTNAAWSLFNLSCNEDDQTAVQSLLMMNRAK